MAQERPEISEQLGEIAAETTRMHSYLLDESTVIRHELEQYLMPLLEWVLGAYTLMRRHKDVPSHAELAERLLALHGIAVERNQVTLDYNVESEMDERTSAAINAIRDAVDEAIRAAESDPLVQATENPQTQTVVDALRSLAESFGSRG